MREVLPALVDASCPVCGPEAQERCCQDRGRNERDEAPDQVSCRRRRTEEASVEHEEATLSTAGATRKRHSRGDHLHHGASSQAVEEVRLNTEGIEHEPGNHIEAGKLCHGHSKREEHRGPVLCCRLEGIGELHDLNVHDLGPVVDILLLLEDSHALAEADSCHARTHNEAGAEADHEERDELEHVHAEDDEVQDHDIAVGLEEELELGGKHDGSKEHDTELEHDEAGELGSRSFARIESLSS